MKPPWSLYSSLHNVLGGLSALQSFNSKELSVGVFCNDLTAEPWHPTSSGSQWALMPLVDHSMERPAAYLSHLRWFASSVQSFQEAVSSSRTTHQSFVESNVNTISGWCKVVAVFSGNLELPSEVDFDLPILTGDKKPSWWGLCCILSPALMKMIDSLGACWFLLSWIAVQILSAYDLRPWSWR